MSPLSESSLPSPEKKVLSLDHSETFMRQFANSCRRELELPALVYMEDEDFRKAATLFVNKYLVRDDGRWDFPEGENGIKAMQQLLHNALFFLGDEQSEPPVNKVNTFVRHAMYAYRGHIAASRTTQSMDTYVQGVANTTVARMGDPQNDEKRVAYFQALSEFGNAQAPNALAYARGKPSELQNNLGLLIAKLNAAINALGQSGLDDATRHRLYVAMLVALENIRQHDPKAFEKQPPDEATQQLRTNTNIAVRKVQMDGQEEQG